VASTALGQLSAKDLKRPCSLGRAEWRFIITTGLLQAAATLSVFVWALNARDLSEARNLAFSVLVFGELFRQPQSGDCAV
jgi:hypothetical protein